VFAIPEVWRRLIALCRKYSNLTNFLIFKAAILTKIFRQRNEKGLARTAEHVPRHNRRKIWRITWVENRNRSGSESLLRLQLCAGQRADSGSVPDRLLLRWLLRAQRPPEMQRGGLMIRWNIYETVMPHLYFWEFFIPKIFLKTLKIFGKKIDSKFFDIDLGNGNFYRDRLRGLSQ
jgi:hypothetical protein